MALRFGRILRGALLVALASLAGALTARFFPRQERPAVAVVADTLPAPPAAPVAESAPVTSARPAEPDVWPVGHVVRGNRVIVVMSDGTRRTDRDPELQAVEINSITLNGRKLYRRPRPEGAGGGAPPDRPDGVPPVVAMRGQTGRSPAVGWHPVGTSGAEALSPLAPSAAKEALSVAVPSPAIAEAHK